jgi:hypothetical protein
MMPWDFEAFVRGRLAELDGQRPRFRNKADLEARYAAAKASLAAAVTGAAGLPADLTDGFGAFVAGQLERRELAQRPTHYNHDLNWEAADTAFITAVMAAAAWSLAAEGSAAPKGRQARQPGKAAASGDESRRA